MAMKLGVSRRMRGWLVVGVGLLVLRAPSIYGCGPWFDEAIFVPVAAPQTSQAEFASGKLGVVLPTMRRSCKRFNSPGLHPAARRRFDR